MTLEQLLAEVRALTARASRVQRDLAVEHDRHIDLELRLMLLKGRTS